MLAALKLNVVFRAKHIAGNHNVIVDQLSRFQFEKARSVAPWLCQGQTAIPGSPFVDTLTISHLQVEDTDIVGNCC